MAEAIISGLVGSKSVLSSQIIVSDINEERLIYLHDVFDVETTKRNQKALDEATIVILAVKPQSFSEVLSGLDFSGAKIVISIAAGITIGYLEAKIQNKPIIRVMPNNPAFVGSGITAIALGSCAKESDSKIAESIFKTVGEVIHVEEPDMDAVTGMSGSGPAFVYLFCEAMVEAGETLGITKTVAKKLAIHTLLGSAETLLKTGKDPKELREMVTSPNGTTKAGLGVLSEKGFNQAVIDAIIAAAKRSKELNLST